MNMRNATCVGTETSKVPTRVTFLFIFFFKVDLALKIITIQADFTMTLINGVNTCRSTLHVLSLYALKK